ncbi:MAG: amino acid adenylation domain-containing protein, partial [Acutalibacteraceae bacterium]|nr:amino acid adenylation domain-containing protein [Acutalibacteraceae bacterium]
MKNKADLIQDIYSLTPLQEGILFHCIMGSNGDYVVQDSYALNFELDEKLFKMALELLSKRYDALRTAIIYEKMKVPKQVVFKKREIPFSVFDFSSFREEEIVDKQNELLMADIDKGFNLQKDTLIRFNCFRLPNKCTKVVFTIHHIIADGWCNTIILDTLFEYYSKLVSGISYDDLFKSIDSERLTQCEYKDYIKWIQKQNPKNALEYWSKLLSDYDGSGEIVSTNVKEQTSDINKKIRKSIIGDDASKLFKLVNSKSITINTLLETALGILLQIYTGSDDVVFGSVVSGRNADIKNINNIVGLFINTIPVRVQSKPDLTASQLLDEMQVKGIESTNYDFCSLADVQRCTPQGGDLIKTLYVFENYTSGSENQSDEADESGLDESFQINSDGNTERNNYDITIIASSQNDRVNISVSYLTYKYNSVEMELFLDRLINVLKQIIDNPNVKLSDIDCLSSDEKKIICDSFNTTDAEYDREKTVVDLLEEQVEKTPDNIAVVFEDEKITYRELNEKANILAHKLISEGVQSGDYVAMYIERSIEMIVGICAIIKAGAIYVPINTMYPANRVEYILNDCNAKIVLVGNTELEVETDKKVINIKEDNETEENKTENPNAEINPESGIYVIYTSGTTGNAKGVEVMHKNVVRLLFNDKFEYDFSEKDVWTMFHSYGFDFSVWEMYGALLYGGKLVVVNESTAMNSREFMELLEKEKVTVLNQVPTAFYNLEKEDSLERKLNVRYLIFGGEALNPRNLKGWAERHPETKIVNMYGITETTVHVTYREIGAKEIEKGVSDIGQAIPTLKVYVMNGMQLCGVGIPGELCVAGDGVARGYLNRPELTAEKFIDNPFGEGKLYRSGDLARWMPDGNLEYLGRIDEQVKIRGFRVELGEIESKIKGISGIKDSAVIAKADKGGDKAIYAYYTSDVEIKSADIREKLSTSLPEYMIPTYMMQIEAIPVTTNGKLNKRALPEIDAKTTKEYIAPRTETEKVICEVFVEILGAEKVG